MIRTYPNIFIPNRGAAWTISFKPEDSEEKTSLRRNINSYNHYLDQLDSIKGFKEFFVEHHCCVSREEITKEWSRTTADFVFSKEAYIFQTDLRVLGDYLIGASAAKADREYVKEPVAAYARVSTEKEEQEDSFERQVEHYTKMIQTNPKWRFVEVYADPGITGTKADKRPNFMRMIDDCRAGKIKRSS